MPQFVVYINYHNRLMHMTIHPIQVYLPNVRLLPDRAEVF